jgi:regulator of extracellular matrix RemA (YlzA/DUF370 family)
MKVTKLTKILCDDDVVFRSAIQNSLIANKFTIAESGTHDAADVH